MENQTAKVIESNLEFFTELMNDQEFLKDIETEKGKKYLIRRIKESLDMVARQKAMDIKHSINTL